MTNPKTKFIYNILKYCIPLLVISFTITIFSKHNLLTDLTAKKFLNAFSNNPIILKKEIAEERRVVYQNIISKKNKHYTHLIIGSSRVMQLGIYTGFNNTLNLGVSGATLPDIRYIYNLTRECNITYDTIIFDFNPWLTIRESDFRYKQFEINYRLKQTLNDIFKFNLTSDDLISFFGLFNNYQLFYSKAKKIDFDNPNNFIKFQDGSIKQKQLNRQIRKKQIEKFTIGLYQMSHFYNINDTLLSQVINLYTFAGTKGKCIVTLTPFHFNLFNKQKSDQRIRNIISVENKLKQIKYNFDVRGSFNPQHLKLHDSDFLDGFHLNEKSINKIFKL
jgi:hypothetical protein